jgi:hypothetical protein
VNAAPSGVPDNWIEVTGRSLDAPTVLFDLDGVISDASHRQGYLREDPPDWVSFNLQADADPPIQAGLVFAASIAAAHRLVIITARPLAIVDVTRAWLDAHDVRHDLLILRPADDDRPSPDMKRTQLLELRRRGADVRLAIDDDVRNVEMYRDEGVIGLYVHSGYYEDGAV